MVRELRNRAESLRRAASQIYRWAEEGIEVPEELKTVIGSEQALGWILAPKLPAA
jgi:hypothetical protein